MIGGYIFAFETITVRLLYLMLDIGTAECIGLGDERILVCTDIWAVHSQVDMAD